MGVWRDWWKGRWRRGRNPLRYAPILITQCLRPWPQTVSLRNRQNRKWGGAGGGRRGIRHIGQRGRQKRERADGDSVNEVNVKNGKGENQSGWERERGHCLAEDRWSRGGVRGWRRVDGEQGGQWVIRDVIRAC